MARAPLAAAMVGKTIGETINNGQLPVYLQRFGKTREAIFVTAEALKREYGEDYKRIPTSAIGLYTYYERLAQGLRQSRRQGKLREKSFLVLSKTSQSPRSFEMTRSFMQLGTGILFQKFL